MYFYFMQFLQIDMAQIVQIIPHGRQGPVYLSQAIESNKTVSMEKESTWQK